MLPILPLARLNMLAALSAVAAIVAVTIFLIESINDLWAWAGIVPLLTYGVLCLSRQRQMILADTGREREIVRMGFVVMSAERAAQFWGAMFSAVAIVTAISSAGVWAYQGYLCYIEQRWVPLTWNAVVGVLPLGDYAYLQRISYWLGDTNFGAVVLISGLLMAAPLAAISWRSNNKARFRRNDLASLKRRS